MLISIVYGVLTLHIKVSAQRGCDVCGVVLDTGKSRCKVSVHTSSFTYATTNGIGQHEPAGKRAKCEVSGHSSIGSG
jgi:hypothetical protein